MMKGMKITVGPLETNSYLVYDDETNKGVLIDPGAEASAILDTITRLKIEIEYIILTHTHFDHIGAVKPVQKYTNAPVLVNVNETNIKPDWTVLNVNDGQKVPCENLVFEFILTPGHTPGSMCVKCESTLFTGDTLFRENCGRCDLPGGDYLNMLKSLKRLAQLEGDYTVCPGHGDVSMLSYEREHNPYMRESLKCE